MFRPLLELLVHGVRLLANLGTWPSRLLALVGLLTAVGGGWAWSRYHERPARPPLPQPMALAVRQVCDDVAASLPVPRRALRPTLVLPLVDDRELLVTETLRERLQSQGRYRPVELAAARRATEAFFSAIGRPVGPVTDRETAQELAQAASAEVVIFGRLEQLEVRDERTLVSLHVSAFAREDAEPLLDRTFAPTAAPTAPGPGGGITWMLAGVVLFALLWPPLTAPAMRSVLRWESNGATAVTILAITAVPAVLAWPVVFGTSPDTWRIVGFVLGALACSLWCMTVMSWVAKTE